METISSIKKVTRAISKYLYAASVKTSLKQLLQLIVHGPQASPLEERTTIIINGELFYVIPNNNK